MMEDVEEPVIPLKVKRLALAAGVVLLLLLIGLTIRGVIHASQRERHVASYEQQMEAGDPNSRLAAADLVLSMEPGHVSAMLARSEALLELQDPLRARAAVANLQPDLGSDLSRRVALLRAQSYLMEARAVVDGATPHSVDMVNEGLDQLLQRLDEMRVVLVGQPQWELESQWLEAQALDVRASLLHAMRGREASDLARAQAVAFEEQIELVGVRVSDLGGRLEDHERRLGRICEAMLKTDPNDIRPRLLQFRSFLRHGEIDRARTLAWEVAQRQTLPPAVVGDMAWALLNLDTGGTQNSTDHDVDMARKLLAAADPGTSQPLVYRMARVALELRHGDADEAVQLAEQLQRDYSVHPPVTWLLGRALIRANRPQQALRIMQSLVQRIPSAQARYVLAMAMIATRRFEEAQGELRASLEQDPQNLAARIELARLLMLDGLVTEAEPDIEAALRINPRHPQVMALHCQLVIHRLDFKELRAYIATHAADDGIVILPRHVDLMAAMVLDDRPHVQEQLNALGEVGWDWLAVLAKAWLQSSANRRAEVAAVLASSMMPMLDGLPLSRPGDPVVHAKRRVALAGDGTGPLPMLSPMQPLSEWHFFPWPHHEALRLVELGRGRWPLDAALAWREVELRLWLGDWAQARVALDQALALDAKGATFVRAAALQACFDDDPQALTAHLKPLDDNTAPTQAWLQLTAALRHGHTDAATAALTHLLRTTAWPELAMLEAIRHATLQKQEAQVDAWVALAAKLQPALGSVLAARVALSRQDPATAIARLQSLLQEGTDDSLPRCLAAEVTAVALLVDGKLEAAVALIGSMPVTSTAYQSRWLLGGIDVLIEARRQSIAEAAVFSELTEREQNPHMTDQLFARAQALSAPRRVERLAANLLSVRPDDPVLTYYRAQALLADQDFISARQLLQTLIRRVPTAQRVRVALARLEAQQGSLEQARLVLQPMLEQGESSARVARQELEQLEAVVRSATPPPSPSPAPPVMTGTVP